MLTQPAAAAAATPMGISTKRTAVGEAEGSDGNSGLDAAEEKLQLCGEAIGQLYARVRILEAGAGRVYMMPKDVAPVTEAKAQLTNYSTQVYRRIHITSYPSYKG